MEPTFIYIADNQYLACLGLSSILRSFYGPDVIIEHAANYEALEYKILKNEPFLIAIDYANFDLDSIYDIAQIRKIASNATILVVSENKDSKQIKDVLKSGVSHYIFKSGTEDDFYNALRAIQNKRKYICAELYDILLLKEKKTFDPSKIQKLSKSETEIARLIANGQTTKEIAETRNLSFHTINTQRKNIFRKLSINNASELVRYAMNSGIISDIEYYI